MQHGLMTFQPLAEILGASNRLPGRGWPANEAISNHKTHTSQKAPPPWCITWHYQSCNK